MTTNGKLSKEGKHEGLKSLLVWILFNFVIASPLFFSHYGHFIFPIMDKDEYFIDNNNFIHNDNCHCRSVPWFTEKHKKYDFLKEHNYYFCSVCFTADEKDKMYVIHKMNIIEMIYSLIRAGAPDDYIEKKLKKYED